MLLTIHNLPSNTRYTDVKSLLQEKCGLTELILDNLVNEGKTKKVTVGLADEGDAAILVRKINGLYVNGLQLYVEDKRKKKDSDQPYRSAASMQQEAQYQEPVANPHMMEAAMMPNIPSMMMNYNMMGMYMPVATMDQNMPYMAYGVTQAMPAAEFVPAGPVVNERGFAGFQGGGEDPGRAREVSQAHKRDRNRRPSPKRPAEYNRPRWNEKPAPKDFGRREMTPPRKNWAPPETNQGPRAPFHSERLGPKQPPRQPEPEFRRTDPQWEARPSRWDATPAPRIRPEPEREWADSGASPGQNRPWGEPNPSFEEPNQQWDGYSQRPKADFPQPDHFGSNEERFDEDYPPNQFGNERELRQREPEFRRREPEFGEREPEFRGHGPEFRGRGPEFRGREPELREREPELRGHEPEFRGHEPEFRVQEPEFRGREPEFRGREPEFRGREPEFRGREPEFREVEPEFRGQEPEIRGREPAFRGPKRPEHGHNNEPDRRPRQPENPWNKGNQNQDKNFAPNNWGQDRDRGERREDRRPQQGRPEKHPMPFPSTSQKGNERRDDGHPNLKRPISDREAPANWKQVANDYPASKKPKGIINARDNFPVRPRPPIKENFNARPQPFKPAQFNRPTRPINPQPPAKPVTMRTLINKDQTSRGQATATLAKEIVPPSQYFNPDTRPILKDLKQCIKSRIDVMLGEELSTNYEDVIKRYRLQFSKNKDRELYKTMLEKRDSEKKERDGTNAEPNTKPIETVVKKEPVVKEETPVKQETPVQEETKKKEESAVTEESALKEETVGDGGGGSQDPEPPLIVQRQEVNIEPNQKQTKASNRPLTEKQIISEQKKQRKLEFSKADLFKLDPALDQVLEEELDKLTEVFASECDRPADDAEQTMCKRITTLSADEFKKVLRLHVTKRILNVTTGLPLRIFAEFGKLPNRTAIKEYLSQYHIQKLTLKKNKIGTMYVANLNTYADYDHLCSMERDIIAGTPVTFRSMNLLGPLMRMSKNQVKQRRQDAIQRQMESIDPGEAIDEFEDMDFAEDGDGDGFNEEDFEDF